MQAKRLRLCNHKMESEARWVQLRWGPWQGVEESGSGMRIELTPTPTTSKKWEPPPEKQTEMDCIGCVKHWFRAWSRKFCAVIPSTIWSTNSSGSMLVLLASIVFASKYTANFSVWRHFKSSNVLFYTNENAKTGDCRNPGLIRWRKGLCAMILIWKLAINLILHFR